MNKQLILCEFCKSTTNSDSCELGTHRTEINGEEHVFCCVKCAQRFKQRKKGLLIFEP